MRRFLSAIVSLSASILLAGCISLVSPYDATFDTSLNKLSEDTAKFLAAASAGGPERNFESKEAVAYYAATYNVVDRLIERGRLTRGRVPCPTDAQLPEFVAEDTAATPATTLPADYKALDCREFQLYAVRIYVDLLKDAHRLGGTLNGSEARSAGGILQAGIMGAIETFITSKPAEKGA